MDAVPCPQSSLRPYLATLQVHGGFHIDVLGLKRRRNVAYDPSRNLATPSYAFSGPAVSHSTPIHPSTTHSSPRIPLIHAVDSCHTYQTSPETERSLFGVSHTFLRRPGPFTPNSPPTLPKIALLTTVLCVHLAQVHFLVATMYTY